MGEKDEAKQGDGGGAKKGDGLTTVVLKLDLHCEGCAKKVKSVLRRFEGVVDVKADASSNKVTVTGSVDPSDLREKVENKIGKKVELLSHQAQAKKDDGGKGGDNKKAAEEKPAEKKKPSEDTKKAEPKPPAPMNTVLLKIRLHCEGCTKKIERAIKKTKGVDSVNIDLAKDLVTVKGGIESNELVSYLKDKLKRNVEAVSSKKGEGGSEKKEKEVKKDEGAGGEKKEKQGGGEKKEKEGGGGGEKKEKETGGDKKKESASGGGNEKKENGGEKKEGGGSQSKGVSTSGGGDGKKIDEGKVEANKFQQHGYPPHSYYTAPMQSRGFADEGYGMPQYNNQGYNYNHGYSSQGGYTTQVYANQHYPTPSYSQTYPNHGHVAEYANQLPSHGHLAEYSHQPPPMYYHAPPQGDYLHAPPTPAYVNAPQMFSDENPNACSVM